MPITVTPSGPISLPLYNLAKTIAASSTFRARVGASNAAQALSQKIHYFFAPGEILDVAVVRSMNEDEALRATFDSWRSLGPLMVLLELTTPNQYLASPEDAGMWFANQVGAISRELRENAIEKPDQYLNITNIQVSDLGMIDPVQRNGVQGWGCELIVQWEGQ